MSEQLAETLLTTAHQAFNGAPHSLMAAGAFMLAALGVLSLRPMQRPHSAGEPEPDPLSTGGRADERAEWPATKEPSA